ncbi:DEAD/DEAH box helicase [Pseudoalteromonas phenolica]|uniref:DEAD/DEAH box helicase n=1 Tax=Pseudoalteromonas phenolica TaxID=161398 RepID=UPI00384EAC47
MEQIDKKIVVNHLETKCDRRLFLSIINHGGKKNLTDPERERLEIPDPFKLRSRGLGISQREGKKLEKTYYEILRNTLPANTIHLDDSNNNQYSSEKDLLLRCQKGINNNTLLLEASFSTKGFMHTLYEKLGVETSSIPNLPDLGFMRPDIILASDIQLLTTNDEPLYEVLPDGDIKHIEANESRTFFMISDVKLADEAGVGQFAEAALYSWMLSNWLAYNNLDKRYLVVDTIGIWTKHSYATDKADNYIFKGDTVREKLKNWMQELSTRTFDQYMLPLKRVLIEDIPRVLVEKENWQDLEYHLTPNCDICDYLGMMSQKYEAYKKQKIRNFSKFCAHCSYQEKHLSIVPGVTKGARRAINEGGVHAAQNLSELPLEAFNTHSELKKQRHRLIDKANAVLRRTEPSFFPSKNITLARMPNLGIMFHINYDISYGLAASFSVQGAFSAMAPWNLPKEKRPKTKFFEKDVFIVQEMKEDSELTQLKLFLTKIEEMFDWASDSKNNVHPDFDMSSVSKRPTVQFYCWDRYQLEFMRKVLSRHLSVLVSEKFSRSLLWLFSPEELIQDPAYFRSNGRQGKMIAPYICILKDIIQEHGKWPVETAYPLLVVASRIDESLKSSYQKIGWLHKSQLGDYIPRERILEIWLKSVAKSDVKRKALKSHKHLDLSNLNPATKAKLKALDMNNLKELEDREKESLENAVFSALKLSEKEALEEQLFEEYVEKYIWAAQKQVWAISSMRKFIGANKSVEKLAYAPPIMTETILERSQVFGSVSIKSLPADSQLWSIFTILDDQLSLLDFNQEISSAIPALESKFACISVTKQMTSQEIKQQDITQKPFFKYYWVSEDSKNSKLRDQDSYLTLLLQDMPGFPFQRPIDLLRAKEDEGIIERYENNFQNEKFQLYQRFCELTSISIGHFDRVNGWVEIKINLGKPIIKELLKDGLLHVKNNIAIARSAPLPRSHVTLACLKEIKHPVIAFPDPASKTALLKSKPEKPSQKQIVTRAAKVIWQGATLNKSVNEIKESQLTEAISWVKNQTGRFPPNDSQNKAISASLKNALNVIWGPPGTGKTDTSVYILGSELRISQENEKGIRILITGPTKRAVIEILNRLRPVLTALNQERLKLICLSGTSSFDYDFILSDELWRGVTTKAVGHGVGEVISSPDIEGQLQKITDIRELLESAKGSNSLIVVATHHHSIYPLLTGISIKGKAQDAEYPCRGELFDYILVDESSQIDVPNSLPILNSLDDGGCITFVGDHLQMPPIQQAEAPTNAKHLVGSIQNYLRERHKIEPYKLLTNYRSNEVIVNFGKRLGYPVELHAANPTQHIEVSNLTRNISNTYLEQLQPDLLDSLFNPDHPVVSIRYRDGMSGQANPFETMLTVNMILKYYQSASDLPNFDEAFWRGMVGVVTPHKAQRALIVKELCRIFPTNLHTLIDQAVDTVERFQGGERNLIIISYGVGDEDIIRQEEEFLLNLNRTNVSISRAKQQAVLIMSEELLQHLTADESIADHAKALKRYDHYCNKEKQLRLDWQGKQRVINYRWRD